MLAKRYRTFNTAAGKLGPQEIPGEEKPISQEKSLIPRKSPIARKNASNGGAMRRIHNQIKRHREGWARKIFDINRS